jgi:transcriptional regulator with XRE-family HTH domain
MSDTKLKGAERFKAMLDRAKKSDRYWVDGAKIELSEQIFVAMQEVGMSEAELSRKLGVSRAYVNKILKGAANLTIESLVKVGRSLGREFKFEFASPKLSSRGVRPSSRRRLAAKQSSTVR